jgi:hypothetical protein
MHSHVVKSASRVIVMAFLAAVPISLVAQEAPKPALTYADAPSRDDIFAGYSYFKPGATVDTLQPDGVTVLPMTFNAMKSGLIASGAFYFNRYVGLQVEEAAHDLWVDSAQSNGGAMTLAGGLIARTPGQHITPFLHGLVGGAVVGGPQHQPFKWGPDLTAGGGMDLETPWFNHHLAIRMFQADYEYIHENWGPGVYGGRGNLNAGRLSTGLTLHVGSILPPPQLEVACAVNPTSVFPGDPVTATATVSNQLPKENLITTISGDGISAPVNGTTANVNTSNLNPGTYTAKCDAKEGKPGHEGLKPWQVANQSTASYTVKEFEPPTISCSANPSTLKPGDSSTITATGMSPQNRPLTYTYSASAGTINGNGTTATFSSTGAPTGPVNITCNVADDKGHNASANTAVSIEAPVAPPTPHTQTLCSINFTKDKARPTRVDNEAKACLDEVALGLQNAPDAKAVVVGESSAKEKDKLAKDQARAAKRKNMKVIDPAAQRAVNTKDYLVKDKGIDPSRISVATGSGDGQEVENYLVPSGANFSTDIPGTNAVDESTVTPIARKALGRAAKKKPAAQ